MKAYAIGYFDSKKKCFEITNFGSFGYTPNLYLTREDAENALKGSALAISFKDRQRELIVVEVSIKKPKYKREVSMSEIQKVFGKNIIITK